MTVPQSAARGPAWAGAGTDPRIPRVVVTIPAYDEAANIERVVRSTREALPHATVLVVDDGSRDGTGRLAAHAGARVVRLPFNLGIGGAVQAGLRIAREERADYVVRLDGDGQHPVESIAALLEPVMSRAVDVAVGSRFCPGAQPCRVNLARRAGVALFSWLGSWLTGQRITDPTSGFMAMTGQAAAFLALNLPQDYPEVDGRVLLARAGYRVREYPVTMRPREAAWACWPDSRPAPAGPRPASHPSSRPTALPFS